MSTPATGPSAIERLFIQEYQDRFQYLSQQTQNKLLPYVGVQTQCTGKQVSPVYQYGELEVSTVTTCFGDTPESHIPTERRWFKPTDADLAVPIEKFDQSRLDHDQVQAVAGAFVPAFNRWKDSLIIEGLLGTALTGETGATSTAFDTSNQAIAAGSKGLTVGKLRDTRKIFEEADIDLDGIEIPMVISPAQHQDLLEQTEIINGDYSTRMVLENGMVRSFLGFRFIVSTRIPGASNYTGINQTLSPAANEHWAVAWIPSGIAMGTWRDMTTEMYQRRDKRSNWEVYASITAACTRLQENHVVRIATDHS